MAARSTMPHCDTLGLVAHLENAGNLEDFKLFATTDIDLGRCPTLISFVQRRIYGVMTDQQAGEGVFNMADMLGRQNMSMQTLGATLMLGYNGRLSVSDELRIKVRKDVRRRGKDYGSMAFIKRLVDVPEPEAKQRAPRRKAHGASCSCGLCFPCGACLKNFVNLSSRTKHRQQHHPHVVFSSAAALLMHHHTRLQQHHLNSKWRKRRKRQRMQRFCIVFVKSRSNQTARWWSVKAAASGIICRVCWSALECSFSSTRLRTWARSFAQRLHAPPTTSSQLQSWLNGEVLWWMPKFRRLTIVQ